MDYRQDFKLCNESSSYRKLFNYICYLYENILYYDLAYVSGVVLPKIFALTENWVM